ncbi:MAG: hypothetical protein DRH12_05365, partial [Deltaproteobacteria bacterium]
LRATYAGDKEISGTVIIGIRPEHIKIHKQKPVTTNNLLEGKIVDITFLGATQRFHIEYGNSVLAVDRVGMGHVEERHKQSETIFLEIDPKNCLILPA